MPVAPDAAVCPSCGVGQPWIPDEPTLSPRLIRLLACGGAIIAVGLLLFMSGVLMFGSPEREHDHRPPRAGLKAQDSRWWDDGRWLHQPSLSGRYAAPRDAASEHDTVGPQDRLPSEAW